MDMLPGEVIILESDDKSLTLTSLRIRYHTTSWGSADVVRIMLEEVASCGLVHTSYPVLLVMAGVCGIAAVLGQNEARALLVVGVLVSFAVYFVSRKHVLAVGSAGQPLKVALQGMSTEQVMKFIDETEAAKNVRYEGQNAMADKVSASARYRP